MTDKIPSDAALRSRVADLLHLLQFARIETPTAGDAEQAEKAMNDLERMLAAPPAAEQSAPVAAPDDLRRDEAYRNGLMAGFGFGLKGDEAGYATALAGYSREIHEARAMLAAQNPTGDSASPVAEQPDTVSDLGLRHTAPWDSARVGDYNAGWNDRHMAGMRDGEQPDTVAVPRAVLADIAQDAEDSGAQLLANRLRALLRGGVA